MIKYFSIIILLTLYKLKSQDFQFVHYPYTPSKVNPAQIAMIPKVNLSFLYRNQPRPGQISSQSSMATAVYPVIIRDPQKQMGAVALSAQDDRWAGSVPYKSQNITFNFASVVRLQARHRLSFGMQAAMYRKSIDLTDAITGSQYSDLLGYDGSISNGEPMGMLATHYTSLSSGVWWQHSDADQSIKTTAGLAMYNMTRGNQSFIRSKQSSLGYVANLSRRLWTYDRLAVGSDLLWTKTAGVHFISLGAKLSYRFNSIGEGENGIDLYVRHVLDKSSNVSIVINQPKFTFGVGTELVHYQSKTPQVRPTMEILLAYKLNPHAFGKAQKRQQSEAAEQEDHLDKTQKKASSKVKFKKKRKTKPKKKASIAKNKIASKNNRAQNNLLPPEEKAQDHKDSTPVASLQDTTRATDLDTGQRPDHEEKSSSRAAEVFANKMLKNLEFEFKSTQLMASSLEQLKDFADLLIASPEQKVKIVGHSDNIGSDEGNMLISEQRALVVKEHLVNMGIDASRVSTEGQGSKTPLYSNTSEQGRSKNRRVEFHFYE